MTILASELVAVERDLGQEAANVASTLRLRGADAVYVALARRLGMPLVTWDREQRGRVAPTICTMTPAEALRAWRRQRRGTTQRGRLLSRPLCSARFLG
ncbi:MAG: hypothetical protein EXR47_06065 [Dehalococcoidia bacterium]|nr:hypothetical protein [Dehalococcoidia bacterium]